MQLHPRAMVPAAIAVVTLAATAVAATGCGASTVSAGTPASPPAPAATPASASPATSAASPASSATASPAASPGNASGGSSAAGQSARCHTSMLSAHVVPGQPGAGQHYAELVLTNSSGTSCRIYGFPGMQLVSSSGGNVPTAVQRQPGSEPVVTLAPGQQASSLLHWTIVPGTGEGSPCEPSASGLTVTPPDETSPLHTSWPGGPVCQHGQVFVTPFQPGANAT
jgi:hypothetical protein